MVESNLQVVSFEAFYRAEYRSMVALAAAVSGVQSVAEDIAQEALAVAHREWVTICEYEKPGTWLRRATINRALNVRRSRFRESRALFRMRPSADVEDVHEDDDVWQAVKSLPPQQRAAIALFYLEDRPIAEIAEILGCAPNTAKAHLHYGRQALAIALEARHE